MSCFIVDAGTKSSGVSLSGIAGIDEDGTARRAAALEAEVLSVAASAMVRLCTVTTGFPGVLRINNTKVRDSVLLTAP